MKQIKKNCLNVKEAKMAACTKNDKNVIHASPNSKNKQKLKLEFNYNNK